MADQLSRPKLNTDCPDTGLPQTDRSAELMITVSTTPATSDGPVGTTPPCMNGSMAHNVMHSKLIDNIQFVPGTQCYTVPSVNDITFAVWWSFNFSTD
ncbi:hypothetical protein BaRGS_00024872 [Batillaria attramentaria]|uniref:Uncharacterized protein n=1 Tax=Batillaria attramentaria TaxID=370345 RepID=A0ABD0K9U5_9CAEN